MPGMICPYCEEEIVAGDTLWSVFVVLKDASSLILDPKVPSGPVMHVEQTLAHCECAHAVASIHPLPLHVPCTEDGKVKVIRGSQNSNNVH